MGLIASYKNKSKAQAHAKRLRKEGKRIKIKRTHNTKTGVWHDLNSY